MYEKYIKKIIWVSLEAQKLIRTYSTYIIKGKIYYCGRKNSVFKKLLITMT